MQQLTAPAPPSDDDVGEADPEGEREELPISGGELRALVFAKYGEGPSLPPMCHSAHENKNNPRPHQARTTSVCF
jgi:hypothetical protein